MNLTTNFTLEEMVRSGTAKRYGFNNTPNEQQIQNLKILCEKVLQPARNHFEVLYEDCMIRVNSGFRGKQLNDKVGSTDASFHRHGYAADIELLVKHKDVWHTRNKELYTFIKDNLPFTELIWEYGNDDEPDWVHVAYKTGDGRKMVKRIPKK